MFDIAFFVFFSVMAYRTVRAVRREASIFAEFGLPRTLVPLALLLPLGVPVMLVTMFLIPFPWPQVAALCCYLPTLVVARQQLRALETAGTDRVQGAQVAITGAFGASLAGLVYVVVAFAFAYGAQAVGRIA